MERTTAQTQISEQGKSYGIPGFTVDAEDVIAVNDAANEAIKRARQGQGPSLLEFLTYRWRSHGEGYPPWGAEKDAEEGRKHCPINFAKEKLLKNKISPEEFKVIEKRLDEWMQKTYDFAIRSPFPAPEQALEGLFSEGRI